MSCMYTTQGVLVCPSGREGLKDPRVSNAGNQENFYIDETQNIKEGGKEKLFDMSKYCEIVASKDPKTNITSYSFKECPKK